SVQFFVGPIIRTQGRAGKRDAGKDPTSPGIRKNLGSHGHVRFGRYIAPDRTGGDGNISAELHLARENAAGRSGTHQQQYKVGRLSADLESEASTFERHHGRSAPRTLEVLATAAGHDPTSIASPESESELEDRGQNDHTICL